MRFPSTSTVIVGTTGTAAGHAAVRLAAREAVSRGMELRVIHAFTWSGARPGPDPHESRRAAARLVEEAVATAQRSTPGVRAEGLLLDGTPDHVLIRLSRSAGLLVLGDDDVNALARLPENATLVQVAARAWCPVLVARGPRPASGPVLVAVDGSAASRKALLLAADEAVRRDRPLEIAHVLADPGDGRQEELGLDILRAAVASVPRCLRKRVTLLHGDPAQALVRASAHARLLVLGPHGAGGARLLGSVARHVLHRGACPTIFFHGAVPASPAPAHGAAAAPGTTSRIDHPIPLRTGGGVPMR
jgi:nucleotide-binding universal stress UspA family protein